MHPARTSETGLVSPSDVLARLERAVWVVGLPDGHFLWSNDAGRALWDGATGPLFSAGCRSDQHLWVEGERLRTLGEDDCLEQTIPFPATSGPPRFLRCRCVGLRLTNGAAGLMLEGPVPHTTGLSEGTSDLYEQMFRANTAPMLLIDPVRNGAIIDANATAAAFYGYSHEMLCSLHTWEINTLKKGVLPVMHEIASWEGGHRPLRFRHRLSDGSERDVLTYAGPVEVEGRRLMLSIIHDITAQTESEQFNRLLLESIHTGVFGIAPDGHFTFVNPAALRLLGYTHQGELLRTTVDALFDTADSTDESLRAVAVTGRAMPPREMTFLHSDGRAYPVLVQAAPVRLRGTVTGAVISFSDLTEHKAREAQVSDLAHSVPGAVFQLRVAADGSVSVPFVSDGAAPLLGDTPPGSSTGMGMGSGSDPDHAGALLDRVHSGDAPGLRRSVAVSMRRGTPWQREFRILTPIGLRWLLGRALPRPQPDGSLLFNGVLIDISDRKALEIDLERAAHHDPLTGLWNRRRGESFLRQLHSQARRYGTPYTLVMIDIDHFKGINDAHGHDVGDRALNTVTRALQGRLRESDRLCRWGGEEFLVLLPQTPLAAARTLAEALRGAVAGLTIPPLEGLTISLGVAEMQPDEPTHGLIKRADAALMRAKRDGRDRVEVG